MPLGALGMATMLTFGQVCSTNNYWSGKNLAVKGRSLERISVIDFQNLASRSKTGTVNDGSRNFGSWSITRMIPKLELSKVPHQFADFESQ
ncbi:hypothetical protein TNCV_3494301 [Trichonephila clavipes]|nr:hypothetical protein TNCV_3494301 [Trichonephila clavipes]